jgi:hypothetical protein
VVIHYSEEVVNRFRIIASDVTGDFGRTARGSIIMEGPTRTGRWWRTAEKLGIGPEYGVLGTIETWTQSFIIWPDCVDEFVYLVDDELRTLPIKLTFIAIGRVKWNRQLVLGLVLKINETHKDYTRIGLFQCPDEEESAIKT